MTAAAYTACGLVLAGCGAWAVSVLPGPAAWTAGRIRAAARRARHGRVPGLPGDGKGCLSDDEFLAFLIIELRWDRPAPEQERSS